MVRSVAGNLPEQVKNNQSVNTAAGNGGQKMSQYSWFTVYLMGKSSVKFDLFANSRLILADGLGDGGFGGAVRNAGENDTPFL